jgi:hypothetical protein
VQVCCIGAFYLDPTESEFKMMESLLCHKRDAFTLFMHCPSTLLPFDTYAELFEMVESLRPSKLDPRTGWNVVKQAALSHMHEAGFVHMPQTNSFVTQSEFRKIKEREAANLKKLRQQMAKQTLQQHLKSTPRSVPLVAQASDSLQVPIVKTPNRKQMPAPNQPRVQPCANGASAHRLSSPATHSFHHSSASSSHDQHPHLSSPSLSSSSPRVNTHPAQPARDQGNRIMSPLGDLRSPTSLGHSLAAMQTSMLSSASQTTNYNTPPAYSRQPTSSMEQQFHPAPAPALQAPGNTSHSYMKEPIPMNSSSIAALPISHSVHANPSVRIISTSSVASNMNINDLPIYHINPQVVGKMQQQHPNLYQPKPPNQQSQSNEQAVPRSQPPIQGTPRSSAQSMLHQQLHPPQVQPVQSTQRPHQPAVVPLKYNKQQEQQHQPNLQQHQQSMHLNQHNAPQPLRHKPAAQVQQPSPQPHPNMQQPNILQRQSSLQPSGPQQFQNRHQLQLPSSHAPHQAAQKQSLSASDLLQPSAHLPSNNSEVKVTEVLLQKSSSQMQKSDVETKTAQSTLSLQASPPVNLQTALSVPATHPLDKSAIMPKPSVSETQSASASSSVMMTDFGQCAGKLLTKADLSSPARNAIHALATAAPNRSRLVLGDSSTKNFMLERNPRLLGYNFIPKASPPHPKPTTEDNFNDMKLSQMQALGLPTTTADQSMLGEFKKSLSPPEQVQKGDIVAAPQSVHQIMVSGVTV